MQGSRFHDGGAVVHKIVGQYKGKVSAWFNAQGGLIDAEQIIGDRCRPVKRHGPMWKHAQATGGALFWAKLSA